MFSCFGGTWSAPRVEGRSADSESVEPVITNPVLPPGLVGLRNIGGSSLQFELL